MSVNANLENNNQYNFVLQGHKGSIETVSPVVPEKVKQIDPHVHQYNIKIRVNAEEQNIFVLPDRPLREGGTASAKQFIELWTSPANSSFNPANNSFSTNPPNATFSGFDPHEKKTIFIPMVVTDATLIEEDKYLQLSVLVNVIKSQLFPLGLGPLAPVPDDLHRKLTNINVWVDQFALARREHFF